jgi:BirA family biotin operon repressor/biotin-[acetyl-CoA-carboxylase] ligase
MPGDRISGAEASTLGCPRLHLRRTDSTNERARKLAIEGAPHGTLVTANEQSAGRGRQGRAWLAPPGRALLCSLVLREPPALLSLIAGVAVCDAVGNHACVKWPNDIVVQAPGASSDDAPAAEHTEPPSGQIAQPKLAKLAGILVEGRPQEGWAVLGIGLNVAVRVEQLPPDLRGRAASLELPPSAIEPLLSRLLEALEMRLSEPAGSVLDAWRAHDALLGREVSWGHHGIDLDQGSQSAGRASGIDEMGRLVVTLADGSTRVLDAGEVHLGAAR